MNREFCLRSCSQHLRYVLECVQDGAILLRILRRLRTGGTCELGEDWESLGEPEAEAEVRYFPVERRAVADLLTLY